MKWLRWLLPLTALWLLAFIVVWHNHIWWWCEVHLGIVNEAGPYYAFWSGFGSDLGEYVIIGTLFNGVWLHYQHLNCHDPEGWLPWGCWRLGKYPAAGGTFKLCHRHHPDFAGRRPARELIHRHHREHKERQAAGGAP